MPRPGLTIRHVRIWIGYYYCVSMLACQQSGLVTLTIDLLTLKAVSESRVTSTTSVPILVFLCLSVLELRPTYATDRRQTSDKSIA